MTLKSGLVMHSSRHPTTLLLSQTWFHVEDRELYSSYHGLGFVLSQIYFPLISITIVDEDWHDHYYYIQDIFIKSIGLILSTFRNSNLGMAIYSIPLGI